MSNEFFARHLSRVPVIAILRGHAPDDTVRLAGSCFDAGIELVEVPAQGDSGLAALAATVSAARGENQLVGAGTVYTTADAQRARAVGAAFLVAPGLDAETVELAQAWGMPYLPGVTTPTEVQRAKALGLTILKLFPAAPLGAEWIRALHGPFPDVNFVAVGGISSSNASEFIDAGAVAVGVGGGLGNASNIDALAQLTPRRADPREGDS